MKKPYPGAPRIFEVTEEEALEVVVHEALESAFADQPIAGPDLSAAEVAGRLVRDHRSLRDFCRMSGRGAQGGTTKFASATGDIGRPGRPVSPEDLTALPRRTILSAAG